MPSHVGSYGRALCWFRRDLRDFDHAALASALDEASLVYCAFVFDREILDSLPDRADRRLTFIRASLVELDTALRTRGGGLIVVHDRASTAIPQLARSLQVSAVYCNHDYEPAAIARDAAVAEALSREGIAFHSLKDQVIFERAEILTQQRTPYTVYTPYMRMWLRTLSPAQLAAHEPGMQAGRLAAAPDGTPRAIPRLEDLGFADTGPGSSPPPGMSGGAQRFADFQQRIVDYAAGRDFPALDAPSHLSVDLRFGTVSVRHLVSFAHSASLHANSAGAATWLNELIWREFFAQLLWHFPQVTEHAFRPAYDELPFRNDEQQLAAWCEGRTGYPLVDAAMRQLNGTGYMHNRLRMVAASFLVKHLLIDWRLGERYFARKLIDYELASNNGGWQWAASTGCDAQPYFRIFNPVTQSQRFDAKGDFIRQHVPELSGLSPSQIHAPWTRSAAELAASGVELGRDYPCPIVDHATARAAAIAMYEAAARRAS